MIKIMLGSIPHQKLSFYHYLLEDEQELSLGMQIRLQRIYNFLLFHAVIISILDVFIIIYRNFISFFGTNLLTQCQSSSCCFCLFFTSQNISTKRSPIAMNLFRDFFLDQKTPSEPKKCHIGGLWRPQASVCVDSTSQKSNIFQNNSP